MNTYKQSHIFCKAKARRRCFLFIMCFHLVLGDVPGPCRHSATKEHLINIQRLIGNQLQNDCSITYTFMERHSLSKVCYVKAAFPQILELLNTHFQYVKSSDNYPYVFTLKTMVFNIYSYGCIPEINEEIEDDPVRFAKEHRSSPREALGKIKEVIELYMELMTENDKPVDWNCEEEYAEDYPESTTARTQTTGANECHCSCPTVGYGASEQVSQPGTSQWNDFLWPSYLQSHPLQPPKWARPPLGTMNPREHIPVNHNRDSLRGLEEASSTISVREEEKEEVNSKVSFSPPFRALPGTSRFGATPRSTTSFHGKSSGSKDQSASCRRVHSDSNAPRTSESLDVSKPSGVSVKSTRGKDFFLSRIVLEKRSPAVVGPDFIQSPTVNRISGWTRGPSSRSTSFLDSSDAIVSLSKERADNPATSIPYQEVPARSTPTKPEETTAVMVSKRSLRPRVEGLQSSSRTDDQLIRNFILAESPSASEISQAGRKTRTTINTVLLPRRMAKDTSRAFSGPSVSQFSPNVPTPVRKHESLPIRNMEEKLKSPAPRSQSSADRTDSDSSQRAGQDSGNVFQNGAQVGSHFSFKNAFVAASVCGGLLLLITLYCFRKQKKLKALLHSYEIKEHQSLTLCSKDIEMQQSEITERTRLDSS